MKFLDDLAARRRFGMRPGLETIRALAGMLGDPQKRFRAIHIAGTNGKGAVAAMIDAALRAEGGPIGRYTSPHLVRLNERFFLDGAPIDDATLDAAAARVAAAAPANLTFFEALTAVAFLVYAEAGCRHVVLETGLGGRLDATNICLPELCVITRIGLDHCDWLGGTVEKIAAEKAGIIKPHVPVVLGRNEPPVRAVIEARARALDAPFFYAPDLAGEDAIPTDFPLGGRFNRENAVTVLAALGVLGEGRPDALSHVVWPGRFQRVRNFIIDGAHNPPAAQALAASLETPLDLVAGFCGDKDVDEVLRLLAPHIRRGFAVKTNNPRSLSAEETARRMQRVGIPSEPTTLDRALATTEPTLVCGSLFLAGEALVKLGAYPWPARFDIEEILNVS